MEKERNFKELKDSEMKDVNGGMLDPSTIPLKKKDADYEIRWEKPTDENHNDISVTDAGNYKVFLE